MSIRFSSYVKNFESKFDKWEKARVTEASIFMQNKLKETLSQKGTGAAYARGRKVHIASAPGKPPATDSGMLRRTIAREVVKDFFEWVGKVGTPLLYGLWLERGTSRMPEPRPWLKPTFEKNADQVGRILSRPVE
ncbi:MAG: hypothetical protein M0Q24_11485 [Sulfurimonas sp.]|uniref:hypothetical protein n=1 Tax=Sulfurimonas sp. TaxID=2022749 RepID=UPI0025FC37B0|nr:hypothetical protein [Sulfurimonas sp.]MCK9492693.1 hypothetical protein [Sulfurimonas sp.]